MNLLTKFFAYLLRKSEKLVKPGVAYAHCDVPCGIYETDTATHAAETVYAMTEKILALEEPKGEKRAHLSFHNTLSRMVSTKEEWAQKCKSELLILWTDYFKPEHLEKFPGLHGKIWKAAKLCSDVKREVSLEKSKQLKEATAEIAAIFAETKR